MNLLIIPDVGRSYNSVRPEAEIYIGLAKLGHQIIILTDPNGPYAEKYRQHNIHLIELKPGKKISFSAIKKINHIIKQKNIDVVYASKSRTIPNAVFGCIGTKAKMVAYRGTTGGLYKTDITNYLSILHPRINGVICVSNAVTNHVKKHVSKKIHPFVKTIYKGHDLDWYTEPAVKLDTLDIKQSSFNILCIGSPRLHKGMQYMIEAAGYLKHIQSLNIILVGDNFDCEPFQSQIKGTGMADRIIQTGFRNDVPQLAAACDLMVLPSLREGLPRAVLESLANGTPVVTSANEGAMEIIKDKENGLVVPLKNGKAIAEKIELLFNDRVLLKTLTANSKPTIMSVMSHQKTVMEYEQYFSTITKTNTTD